MIIFINGIIISIFIYLLLFRIHPLLRCLFSGRFLVDVYEAMNTIGCSITLSTNHRAESQCIVDNACRISEQKFPVCDSSRNFHMIRLPASLNESSLSNGLFSLAKFEMLLCEFYILF